MLLRVLPREKFHRNFGDTDATLVEKIANVNWMIATALFAIGYFCFGLGYTFSWDNEQEGGELVWGLCDAT